MSSKVEVEQTSSIEPARNKMPGAAASSATSSSTPKVSLFAAESGFVKPENKLSSSLVPICQRNKKLTGSDTAKKESPKQAQRKTKWGPDLTQDATVRRGRALALQIRLDQITQQLASRILEFGENLDSSSRLEQLEEKSSSHALDREKSKQLELEKREVLGEILKLNANFKVPLDYKPLLKEDRIPIPVDSVSCYCKADLGLKTVAGARKFVPGSKLCVQPDINPNAHRTKNSRRERTRVQPPLIPGLPDDVAMGCLIRVPRVMHRKLRLVCWRWYRLLRGNDFYSLRRNLGLAEGWLYVMKRNRDGRNSWHAFDPTYQLWQLLPPLPRVYSLVCGFGCAVLSGCDLYLFGGRDPQRGCTSQVVFYSPRTNRWRKAPAMLRKRNLFGFCVINNCIYVAGGERDGSNPRSAEMYDPSQNRWSFISDMSRTMVCLTGVVYDGKWFLKGLGIRQEIMSEAYCPETNTWGPVHSGLVAGWQNPSITFNGELYVLDCGDGCKLRIYDKASDSWKPFIDSKRHSGCFRALAAALVSLNGKLCIVRNNMGISLVDVSSPDRQMETNPQIGENIAGRGHFQTQVTSQWLNIAGRSVTKARIVHCQVLQA